MTCGNLAPDRNSRIAWSMRKPRALRTPSRDRPRHSATRDKGVIVAAGLYFFFTYVGLAQTLTGLVPAHAMLGAPFVVTIVSATLVGFNWNLVRASESLGAHPFLTYYRVVLPIVSPSVISGALFACVTSLDEVVVVLFLGGVDQCTVPRQMWSGISEQLSPTIFAAATLLIALSVLLLLTAELLRRRGKRLRGIMD